MAAAYDVEIPLAAGRRMRGSLALPERAGASPAVIVIHEILGLNDDIRAIAGRFAENGYVALAPDLIDCGWPRPFCMARFFRGVGRVATGRPYADTDAARAWLAARPDVDGARVGMAGFCIGAGFALLYASSRGKDAVRAVAPFYVGVPNEQRELLRDVCPVVASFGERDRVFAPAAAELEDALTEYGVEHDVKTYPDAGHSFANRHTGLVAALERRSPTHGAYHEPSAEDAWGRTLRFFERHLAAGT